MDWFDRVEIDFHRLYGVDLSSGVLAKRTARWLLWRVHALSNYEESLFAAEVRRRREAKEPKPPTTIDDDGTDEVILG